jgi:hypothetical protein
LAPADSMYSSAQRQVTRTTQFDSKLYVHAVATGRSETYILPALKMCSHFDSLSLESKQLSTTDTNTALQEYLSERTDLSIGNTLDLRLGGSRFELLPGHTVFPGILPRLDQNRIHSNPFQFVYNKIIALQARYRKRALYNERGNKVSLYEHILPSDFNYTAMPEGTNLNKSGNILIS